MMIPSEIKPGHKSDGRSTLLITGANGFVGSNLLRLLHRDFHLLGLVRQPVASLGPLDEGSPESDPASDQQLAASPESDPASGQRNPPAGNPEPHAAENPPGLAPEALLGLLELQGGSIRVDGADVLENPRAWRRNIGYIPQFIYPVDSGKGWASQGRCTTTPSCS